MQTPREETLRRLLCDLYPGESSGDSQELSSQLLQILSQASGDCGGQAPAERWQGDDALLITYADTVCDDGDAALRCLCDCLNRHLEPFASVVHVLPFLKSTSDGGFAVASHEHLEDR